MKPAVLIKIGGRVAEDQATLLDFCKELKELDQKIVLVHGGGAEVSRISTQMGLKPVFRDGIRITSEEEMSVVDMVLAGKVNKQLSRLAFSIGIMSVGISGCDGGLLVGKPLDSTTRTGTPDEVNPQLVNQLLAAGMMPIVSPVAVDRDGGPLNINADEAALALAASLSADALVFISDIPGILREGEVISALTPEQAEVEIANEVITGGMIPKVRASAGALASGVARVVIGGYEKSGELHNLLLGKSGTTIYKEINQ